MKTAHAGKSDNLGTDRGSRLKRSVVRCISQPSMNSFTVVQPCVHASRARQGRSGIAAPSGQRPRMGDRLPGGPRTPPPIWTSRSVKR